ncbi:unnamed protein product [marine sediment metagenome]|uniref:Uncharacterized protein n=1 Tax=marine sediment metagenome TaxID=412755 RepID=X1UBE9_9ZZZZ
MKGEADMIDQVIKFSNGMVMCFDEKGEQVAEYQGRYEKVKDKILAEASQSTRFFRAVWRESIDEIPREEW